MRTIFLVVAIVITAGGCGQEKGMHRLVDRPISGQSGLTYESVQPIFQARCTPCHNFASSYGSIFPLARDGRASLVFHYIVEKKPKEMPPPGSAQSRAITPEERHKIGEWVAAGAPESSSQDVKEIAPNQSEALLRRCWSCHGENGISTLAQRPNLAGQWTEYLENQLKAYRKNDRIDTTEKKMNTMASTLTDEQISFLARYFNFFPRSQKGSSDPISEIDRERARQIERVQSCLSCHHPNAGIGAPILQGQNQSYLEKQLKDFAQGARKSIVMETVARDLTPEEIHILAIWFASGVNLPQSEVLK